MFVLVLCLAVFNDLVCRDGLATQRIVFVCPIFGFWDSENDSLGAVLHPGAFWGFLRTELNSFGAVLGPSSRGFVSILDPLGRILGHKACVKTLEIRRLLNSFAYLDVFNDFPALGAILDHLGTV